MAIYKRTVAYLILASVCAGLLGACASADRPSLLQTPTTARPKPIQETSANMGSLYPANSGGPYVSMVSHRPLFEDRRARNVGDTLTVILNETTSAAKNSNMSAARKGNVNSEFAPGNTGMPFGPYTSIKGIANFAGTGDIKSEGTGGSAANNTFAGTITVTVIEILSNHSVFGLLSTSSNPRSAFYQLAYPLSLVLLGKSRPMSTVLHLVLKDHLRSFME